MNVTSLSSSSLSPSGKAPATPSAVGVVLVTHTDYGARLLTPAEFILGDQRGCAAVSVDGTHEVERTLETLRQAVQVNDTGKGVIVLTDMFGGTPTNLSLSLLTTMPLEVVTGVNLPMLLKVLGSRAMDLSALAKEAKSAGCLGIVVANELLRARVKDKG